MLINKRKNSETVTRGLETCFKMNDFMKRQTFNTIFSHFPCTLTTKLNPLDL